MGREALKLVPARTKGAHVLAWMCALLLLFGWGQSWREMPSDPETGAAAIVDSSSAWRLRRTSLALSVPRLAQVDGFISYPNSIGCVELPVFDELLALGARVFSRERVWIGPGVVDTTQLSRFSEKVGPVLLVLLLFALYHFLRRSLGVSQAAALVATLVVASAPVVSEVARPGFLRLELFVALLFIIQLRGLFAMGRAQQELDKFTWSMVTGGVTGIGLATSPLFLFPALSTWIAFLCAAGRADLEARRNLIRAALLFLLPAIVLGHLPVLGGPWLPARMGPIAGWTDWLGSMALMGAVPLVAMLWRPAWLSRLSRVRVSAAVLGALALLAIGFFLTRGPDHTTSAALFAALGVDSSSIEFDTRLLLSPVLLWIAFLGRSWWQRARSASRESRETWSSIPHFALELGAVFSLGAACLRPELALLLLAPVGAAIAVWWDECAHTRWAYVLAPLSLTWGFVDPGRDAWDLDRHEGLQTLHAARWLRDNTDVPGAWSNIQGAERWGVLCDSELAPLVAWHARRPCASDGWRRNGDSAGKADLKRVLEADSLDALAKSLRRSNLRYVVLGARSLDRLATDAEQRLALSALALGDSALRTDLPEAMRPCWPQAGEALPASMRIFEILDN